MTSNGVSSGAVQAYAGTPPERISEHASARTVKAHSLPDDKPGTRVLEPSYQAPVQVYNSHGEVVPTPTPSTTDFQA